MTSVCRSDPTAADLATIRALETKCHGSHLVSGDRFHPGPRKIDDYNDVKLTEDELRSLVAITGRCEVFVLPTTTAYGFAPAFMLVQPSKPYPDVPTEITVLAKFEERQLPEGWNFDRVADTMFPDERQVAFYGLKFSRNRVDYDY